jgi:hypothetical protein
VQHLCNRRTAHYLSPDLLCTSINHLITFQGPPDIAPIIPLASPEHDSNSRRRVRRHLGRHTPFSSFSALTMKQSPLLLYDALSSPYVARNLRSAKTRAQCTDCICISDCSSPFLLPKASINQRLQISKPRRGRCGVGVRASDRLRFID